MCRSIKKLRGQPVITDEEITAAARQFIRKVSGFSKPSRANQAAFEVAIAQVTDATRELLDGLLVSTPPSVPPKATNTQPLNHDTG